jgi:hypothetical protein
VEAVAAGSGLATRSTGSGSDELRLCPSVAPTVDASGVLTERRWAEPVSGETGAQVDAVRDRSPDVADAIVVVVPVVAVAVPVVDGGGDGAETVDATGSEIVSGQRRLPTAVSAASGGRGGRATSRGADDADDAIDGRAASGVNRPPTTPIGPSA